MSGQWSEVAALQSKRKHLGVAVYHNMIYAVGGRDQHTELHSVERYIPKCIQSVQNEGHPLNKGAS